MVKRIGIRSGLFIRLFLKDKVSKVFVTKLKCEKFWRMGREEQIGTKETFEV
jgi:hypothetical protein